MKSNEKTTFDAMPKEVATALLLSGQSMSNRFRKVCNTARERIVEPVSRSTILNVSAPATPLQKFERKLSKANVKQLTTWLRRAARKGNRLQDLLFDAQTEGAKNGVISVLEQRIAQMDAIGQAIQAELDKRQSRGKLSHV